MLQVDIGVRNDSGVTALAQGPPPGLTYNEGDTPDSRGYPEIGNRWRVGVDFSGRASGVKDHPYRWGLGADLPTGASVTVTGYIRLTTPRTTTYWAGLVQEAVRWWQDTAGTTSITVGAASGENSLLFPGFRITLAAQVNQCTQDGARLKVWKAYSSTSASYLYTIARPADVSCGALNSSFNQYQLTIKGGTLTPGAWVTQCAGSGGVRNVWRVNSDGRNAPYQYPEIAATCP